MIEIIVTLAIVAIGMGLDVFTSLKWVKRGMLTKMNILPKNAIWAQKFIFVILGTFLAAFSPLGFMLLGWFAGSWFMAGIHNCFEYLKFLADENPLVIHATKATCPFDDEASEQCIHKKGKECHGFCARDFTDSMKPGTEKLI